MDFACLSHSPVHTGINRRQVHPLIQVLRWGTENESLATNDGLRLWHGYITSPFPPSGNEGYIYNQDIPYLSSLRVVSWKRHNLNPVTTLWHCKCWQAAIRQMPCKGRNLPNASAQIRWPWRPQGPKGEYIAAGDSHAAVLTTENLFLREGMSAFMKGASRLSCLLFTAWQ